MIFDSNGSIDSVITDSMGFHNLYLHCQLFFVITLFASTSSISDLIDFYRFLPAVSLLICRSDA